MKNYFLSIVLALSFISFNSYSQEKYTLSGTVSDSSNGEAMNGSSIYIKEIKNGASTNEYGFFSITLPKGTYHIIISYLGYTNVEKTIELNSNQKIKVELPEEIKTSEEVIVTGDRPDKNVQDTRMSNIKMDIQQIKKLPALFGEIDVIKNIQMMPGISVAGEGNTGLYVRGGGADQNLILIDEAPVYNASHLFGVFSVFNSDILKSAEIYKGGIPAQYGGRLSSLLDIRTKDGNNKKFGVSGGIGLIASRLMIQGPIIKNKCSFIISGRRTYADLFLKLSNNPQTKDAQLYFYDLNAKINYDIDAKNKVFIAGYFGRDVLGAGNFGLSWGNATGTLRWNHIFGEKLFSNSTFVFSNFDYQLQIKSGATAFNWISNLKEYTVKQDFTYFLNPNNQVNFGVQGSYKTYSPGRLEPVGDSSSIKPITLSNYYSLDEAIYLSNKQKFSHRVSIDYGLRVSFFQNVGADTVYHYANNNPNDFNNMTGYTAYKAGQNIVSYSGLEPRISGRYLLNEKSSIKASYNRTLQYQHLLTNSAAPLPTAQWVPSTPNITPQKADQIALGYFRNFKENMFEASVEGYYKYLSNTIDFKDNAQLIANSHIETEIRRGIGWSYGLEFFLRKNTGRLTGWISYTWSKTQFQIADINQGNPYYASYDRRHNLNIVLSYELSKRWNVSANWVFGSGRPITLPDQKYQFGGNYPLYVPGRNNYRIAPYHRLDISATAQLGKKDRSSLNFSIYNVYGRQNPFTVFSQNVNVGTTDVPVYNGSKEVVMIYLFSIVPSITYNFKF